MVALALVLAFYYWPGREAARNAANEQAAIETIVKENNDFAASIQALKDEVRVSLDPLTRLLEYDRRLKQEGLPPLSAKEFAAELSAANEKLVASGSEEYIDTCRAESAGRDAGPCFTRAYAARCALSQVGRQTGRLGALPFFSRRPVPRGQGEPSILLPFQGKVQPASPFLKGKGALSFTLSPRRWLTGQELLGAGSSWGGWA